MITLTQEEKELLQKSAFVEGLKVTTFIRSQAIKKAREILDK